MLLDVWLLKRSVLRRRPRRANRVCNHPAPNHKWGVRVSETPSLPRRKIHPSNKLFLVWSPSCGRVSIFASPLNFGWMILYTLTVLPVQIIWGVSSTDRWVTVGYRNPHKVKCVFKPLSQRWVPKVYFYSAVNGYGSKPPYGCKIEWSLWKMGTEIIEGEHWVSHRAFIPAVHGLIG